MSTTSAPLYAEVSALMTFPRKNLKKTYLCSIFSTITYITSIWNLRREEIITVTMELEIRRKHIPQENILKGFNIKLFWCIKQSPRIYLDLPFSF